MCWNWFPQQNPQEFIYGRVSVQGDMRALEALGGANYGASSAALMYRCAAFARWGQAERYPMVSGSDCLVGKFREL
jgi:hypothetical protein